MTIRFASVLLCSSLILVGCDRDSGSSEAASQNGDQQSGSSLTATSPEGGGGLLTPGVDMSPIAPIRVVPDILDWGLIAPYQEATASVRLENVSDQPMKILTVQPSCKCTTVDSLEGQVIPPKGFVELEAVLDPQTNTGTRKTVIRVLIDGYSNVLSINAQAEISRPIRATPTFINAVDAGEGGAVRNMTGTVQIASLDGSPFRIRSVHGMAPDHAGEFDPENPKNSYTLNYDLENFLQPDGRYPRYLIFETDRADSPLVEVMVRHRMSSPQLNRNFKLTDYKMNLGRVAPGGSVEAALGVHEATTTGDLIQITNELGYLIELLDQSVDEESDDLQVQIRVTVPEDAEPGFHYFPLQLYASNQSQISIPAFIRVDPASAAP